MLKGALIGFGNIAQKSHLLAFADERIKSKAKIIAVVEPNDLNREKSIAENPELRFYSSLKELISNEAIDFIDNTTPPKFHKNIIEEAIQNNFNIISEKPFALTSKEADELCAKLKNYSKAFVPCHQYKYLNLWQRFKNAADETPSGKQVLLQFNVVRHQADPGLEIFSNSWRINRQTSGGGILADTGIHYLYLSQWILGKPISINCTVLNITHKNYPVEDTVLLEIQFEKGVSQINLTWGGNRRHNSAMLTAENIGLQYLGGTQLHWYFGNSEEIINVPDPSDKKNYVDLYVSLFGDFLNEVKNNKVNNKLVEEAFTSVKLLELAYKSAAERKTILFEDD